MHCFPFSKTLINEVVSDTKIQSTYTTIFVISIHCQGADITEKYLQFLCFTISAYTEVRRFLKHSEGHRCCPPTVKATVTENAVICNSSHAWISAYFQVLAVLSFSGIHIKHAALYRRSPHKYAFWF